MKIDAIETFVVDAGWRPWQFVAVRTSDGITGYGEMSDGRNPYGIVGTVEDFKPLLLERDPMAVEMLYWDMYRLARQSPGGIAAKAIAGIELALWDVKGKALGVPVHSLFGGPTRERQRVYWSHCGSSRARSYDVIGAPPIRTLDDVTALGEEVRGKGFTALKTNIVFPGDPADVYGPGFGGPPGTTDQNITPALLRHIREYISAFKQGAGPDVQIALDLNFHFKPLAARQNLQSARRPRDDVGRDRHVRAGRPGRDQALDQRADHQRREPLRPARVPPLLRAALNGQRDDRRPLERLRPQSRRRLGRRNPRAQRRPPQLLQPPSQHARHPPLRHSPQRPHHGDRYRRRPLGKTTSPTARWRSRRAISMSPQPPAGA